MKVANERTNERTNGESVRADASTVRAVLDDLASRRQTVTTAIVTLAAFYGLDPAAWLDTVASAAAVPPSPKSPAASPSAKGTKRAARPTDSHEAAILAALTKHGAPMRPGDLAAAIGVGSVSTLRYQMRGLVLAKRVQVTGTTMSRRIALR